MLDQAPKPQWALSVDNAGSQGRRHISALSPSKPLRRHRRPSSELTNGEQTMIGFRSRAAGIAAVVVVAPLATVSLASSADAATHFANCTAMHRVYKHGVAKTNAAAAKQVRAGYGRPAVRSALYYANSGSDRDKDGTA